ncbi:MAG: hypothetical protein AB7S56_05225 [Halothiobacillaceae bacterium]
MPKSMVNSTAWVKLDLNNPHLQQSLFALEKQAQFECLRTLKKISGMTWVMVYQDKGLRWEKISSIQAPAGIDQVYSIRITLSVRALVFREGDFMRFLVVSQDHDGVYGKK